MNTPRPILQDPEPATSHQPPATSRQLSATSYQPPAISWKLAAGSWQLLLERAPQRIRTRTIAEPHIAIDRARNAGRLAATAPHRCAEVCDMRIRRVDASRRCHTHVVERGTADAAAQNADTELVAPRRRPVVDRGRIEGKYGREACRRVGLVADAEVGRRSIERAPGDGIRRNALHTAILNVDAVLVRDEVLLTFLHS